jgi:3-methylfumaryl-CoA hydratase
MWASSKVTFLAPITQGAAIARTSTVASVKEKSGSTGTLVFVEVDHATRADGVIAVEERQTIVYREATTTPAAPAPDEADVNLSDWGWHRSLRPAEPLLFRYSALTFNSHRIHYDRPYAVEEECYRGLVVHGPLTATLLLDLAARELGADAVKSFAFRGVSPAIAGEPLHLVARREGAALTLAALGGDGRTVMSAEALV